MTCVSYNWTCRTAFTSTITTCAFCTEISQEPSSAWVWAVRAFFGPETVCLIVPLVGYLAVVRHNPGQSGFVPFALQSQLPYEF